MYTIVPAMQLAAHAKGSTLYGRSYGHKSKFFWLDGLLLFLIIMGLGCARCELCHNINDLVLTLSFICVYGTKYALKSIMMHAIDAVMTFFCVNQSKT